MTEVRNVSAQLFAKELPLDEKATYYGCKNDFLTRNLTTCVNYLESDSQIENAFQKQLSLSNYYKGTSVFEKIKDDYMDQTMEHENKTTETLFLPNQPKITSKATPILPVGPRDFLSKSTFGETKGFEITGKSLIIMILVIVGVIIIMNNIK